MRRDRYDRRHPITESGDTPVWPNRLRIRAAGCTGSKPNIYRITSPHLFHTPYLSVLSAAPRCRLPLCVLAPARVPCRLLALLVLLWAAPLSPDQGHREVIPS